MILSNSNAMTISLFLLMIRHWLVDQLLRDTEDDGFVILSFYA